MKAHAYQLKIIEKKARPPIWRRALIPYGITFSVLAYLMNEIMELGEPPFFRMKFKDEHTDLLETEKLDISDAPMFFLNNIRDAKITFIDEFLKEGSWFTYNYGKKEYRVEVEKIEDDCNISVPMLLGFSKADPFRTAPEGSIQEHTRRLLENCMCDYKEKAVLLNLAEIYRSKQKTGIQMLPATTDPSPEKVDHSSETRLMEEYIEWLKAERDKKEKQVEELKLQLKQLRSQEGLPEQKTPVRLTQKQAFMAFSKEELVDLARDMRIRGASTWKKSELAERMSNEVLAPSWLRKQLLLLTETELKLFRKLCKEKYWYKPVESDWPQLNKLEDMLLVFIDDEDSAAVSVEMKERFQQVDTPAFRKEHAKMYWFCQCLFVVDAIYGSVPISVFGELYAQKKGMMIDLPEMERLLSFLPAGDMTPVIKGDRLIARDLLEKDFYKQVEASQGNKEYYIPEPGEVELLYNYSFPVYDPVYQKYAAFLRDKLDLNDDELFEVLVMTFRCLALGGMISDVQKLLDAQGIVFPSQEAVSEFVPLIIDLSNHTRMMSNCGHTPDEMSLQRRNYAPGQPVKKAQKIYPNDPCPCGSGKKYKKCCGRK